MLQELRSHVPHGAASKQKLLKKKKKKKATKKERGKNKTKILT